jgi:hypothetical protein
LILLDVLCAQQVVHQMLYLLSPSAKNDAHHNAHAHGADKAEKENSKVGKGKADEPESLPLKDDEGNEASADEVKDSLKQSYVSSTWMKSCCFLTSLAEH